MIRFYFHPTPNPAKVALFLEEAELEYEVFPVDTSKGEQHLPAFRSINPNGKVPAIVDTDGPGGTEARVFDSSAILLYLADKTQRFAGSACGPARIAVMAVLHQLGARPVFRPGGALPARRTGEDFRMRSTGIGGKSSGTISVLDEHLVEARVHRRERLFDRRYVRLGMARTRRASIARRRRNRLPHSRICAVSSMPSAHAPLSHARARWAATLRSSAKWTKRRGARCFHRIIRKPRLKHLKHLNQRQEDPAQSPVRRFWRDRTPPSDPDSTPRNT